MVSQITALFCVFFVFLCFDGNADVQEVRPGSSLWRQPFLSQKSWFKLLTFPPLLLDLSL